MADLPDFTQAVSNQGTVIFSGTVAIGALTQLDVSAYQSVTVCARNNSTNTKVWMILNWYADNTFANLTNIAYLLGESAPAVLTTVNAEMPLYGGGLRITNDSGTAVLLTVIGSSRTVPNFHVLNDSVGSRLLGVSGSVTVNVGVLATALDGLDPTVASNGSMYINAVSNIAAQIFMTYLDNGGNNRSVSIGTLAANTTFQETVACPQGVVTFTFLPGATNAAASFSMVAVASQLN